MKVAVVNNSLNPDLMTYFTVKERAAFQDVFFYSCFAHSKFTRIPSSFSRKNGLSGWLPIDIFWGVALGFFLKFKGIKIIIYDTAHISNLGLSAVTKIMGLKQVFTIHDWEPHEGKMKFATTVYNWAASGLLADELIVFSSVIATKKTHRIRLSGFELGARSDTERSGVLFFGRIQPYKGVRHLPLIAKKLGACDPNIRIRVVGAGSDPHLRELEQCANVDVLNDFIPEELLDKELSETAVVILPYDSATQSGVVIKSFAFGVPVVAFDVGNLREYISDGLSGRLVKHADLDGFVDAVLDTITNQKKFSEIILKNFDKDFGVQALTSQYASLLEQWRETKC